MKASLLAFLLMIGCTPVPAIELAVDGKVVVTPAELAGLRAACRVEGACFIITRQALENMAAQIDALVASESAKAATTCRRDFST